MNTTENTNNTSRRMPAIFVGHGSPMNAINNGLASQEWQKRSKTLPQPKAIIAISGHWATRGLWIRRSTTNPHINDMYGFPKALYEIPYAPAGSIEITDHVIDTIGADFIKPTTEWGIDHGVWSVLMHLYPKADIPVIIISVDMTDSPKKMFELGRRLRPLRDEGYLIFGSGNVVHNLREVEDVDNAYDWALTFDQAVTDAVIAKKYDQIVNYKDLPYANRGVPTADHFLPLPAILGASYDDETAEVWNHYGELGGITMTSFTFDGK